MKKVHAKPKPRTYTNTPRNITIKSGQPDTSLPDFQTDEHEATITHIFTRPGNNSTQYQANQLHQLSQPAQRQAVMRSLQTQRGNRFASQLATAYKATSNNPAKPASPTLSSKVNYIQRTLQGTANALEEIGGKEVSTLKAIKLQVTQSTWIKILKNLHEYEKLEQIQAELVNTALPEKDEAKVSFFKKIPKNFGEMSLRLNEIISLVENWLANPEHNEPIKGLKAAIAKPAQEDRSQKSPDLSNDNVDTARRYVALQNILPRLKAERARLNSYLASVEGMNINEGLQQARKMMEIYSDELRVSGKDNALGGQASKLDLVNYQRGKDDLKTIYKPDSVEDKKRYPQAVEAGIPRYNPNWGGRNVASARLDQLLDAQTIVKTEFATHQREQLNDKGEKLGPGPLATTGVMMGIAEGKEARKDILGKDDDGKQIKPSLIALSDREKQKQGEAGTGKVSLDDPVLQRGLNKLQILDALCGQVDRHNANFFIDFNAQTGKVNSVTGIDNDMAFGDQHRDPRQAQDSKSKAYKGLPPLVDRELGAKILALKAEDVATVLEGLITPAEIAATLERLNGLKEHINGLKIQENSGGGRKLLAPDEWNEQTAKAQNDKNSYLGGLRSEALKDTIDQGETIIGNTGVGNKYKLIMTNVMENIIIEESLTPPEGIAILTDAANRFAAEYLPVKAQAEAKFEAAIEQIKPIEVSDPETYKTRRLQALAEYNLLEPQAMKAAADIVFAVAMQRREGLRELVAQRRERQAGKRGGVRGAAGLLREVEN